MSLSIEKRLFAQPKIQVISFLTFSFLALLVFGFFADPYYFGSHDGSKYFELAGLSLEKGAFHCGLYQHAYWSPVWVELTALLYRTFTHHPQVIQVFLSGCAVISAAVVYMWGCKSLGHTAALVASFLSLATIYVFEVSGFHQYELFVGCCLVLACFLTVSSQASEVKSIPKQLVMGIGAGVLITLAILSAAKMVLVGIAIGVYLLVKALQGKNLYIFGAYLCVGLVSGGLWVERNFNCFGEFIPLTTNGGVVYYIAHNPDAKIDRYVDPYTVGSDQSNRSIAAHESAKWYALGNEYIANHPVETAVDAAVKFWLFFKPRYADQSMVIFLCLFVIWLRMRKKIELSKDAAWWIGVPVLIALLHSMYHLESRYILPVWPFLSLFAAQAFAKKV